MNIIEFDYCGLHVKVDAETWDIESATAGGYEINDLLNAKADQLLKDNAEGIYERQGY